MVAAVAGCELLLTYATIYPNALAEHPGVGVVEG